MNQQNWQTAFEEYAQQLVEESKVPGTIIGLCKDGELFYSKTFGYGDAENQLKISLDTVFGIGSITKSFTGVAIMQLQEEGKLKVHDPVINYLPEFRMPNDQYTKDVTIHHFLTHTAGLPPLPSLYAAMKRSMNQDPSLSAELSESIKKQNSIDTFEELMDYISVQDIELLGPPGHHFSYCNEGYALLGAIIERVSGKTFEQYVYDHILQPAGMVNTVFLLEDLKNHDDIAMIYSKQLKDGVEEVKPAPVWWDAPSMRAAGFLKSTIRDLLRYTEIFRTGGQVGGNRILSYESVKEMTSPLVKCDDDKYYGYGFMVVPDYYGGTLIEHGGGIKGVSSQIYTIPEKGITGAILTNVEAVPVRELMVSSLNATDGRAVCTPIFSYNGYDLPVGKQQEYVGEYLSGEGAKVALEIVDGILSVKFQDTIYPLKAVAEDRFFFKRRDSYLLVNFLRDEDDHVKRMSFGFRYLTKNVDASVKAAN